MPANLAAPEIRVGITGAVYRGPSVAEPAAAPADATTPPSTDFRGLGYVSEDGVTESWDDSVDNIVAWQNATTVRSSTTESTGTLEFKLIQTNALVLETFHRGSTVVAEGGEYRLDVKPVSADPRQWIIDVIDGARHQRIYLGNAEVTERGDIMYQNGEEIGYPLTLTVYPDENGNLMQKWSDDIAWAPALAEPA